MSSLEPRKTCTKCHTEKPMDDFHFCKRDGYKSRCKVCFGAERKAWWAANPEKKKKKRKASEARLRKTVTGKERRSRQMKRAASELTDYYIKTLILATSKTLHRKDIPDSLVAACRALLTLKREIKGAQK